jgi:hypothetical protein
MGYTTTPELLKTIAAVATKASNATTTAATTTASASMPVYTGAASVMFPGAGLALSVAIGITACLF